MRCTMLGVTLMGVIGECFAFQFFPREKIGCGLRKQFTGPAECNGVLIAYLPGICQSACEKVSISPFSSMVSPIFALENHASNSAKLWNVGIIAFSMPFIAILRHHKRRFSTSSMNAAICQLGITSGWPSGFVMMRSAPCTVLTAFRSGKLAVINTWRGMTGRLLIVTPFCLA